MHAVVAQLRDIFEEHAKIPGNCNRPGTKFFGELLRFPWLFGEARLEGREWEGRSQTFVHLISYFRKKTIAIKKFLGSSQSTGRLDFIGMFLYATVGLIIRD